MDLFGADVLEHEAVVPIVETPFGPFRDAAHAEIRARTILRNLSGHLYLSGLGNHSAVIVSAEFGKLSSTAQIPFLAKVRDPGIRSMPARGYFGSMYNPDEFAGQDPVGSFVVTEGRPWTGNLSGRFQIYLSMATAEFLSGAASHTLFSRAWNETDYAGIMIRRHIVWYEIIANRSRGDVAARYAPTGNTQLFVRSAVIQNVSSVSSNAITQITGNLPKASENRGASFWATGRLMVNLKADDPATGPFEYVLRISGTPTALSYGGGPPFFFEMALGASGSALLIAVLALAWFFRSLLAENGLRLVLPFYTKLRKSELLNVPARDDIYRAIKENPGIHFLALFQRLATPDRRIAFGALSYHLSQMERFNLIVSKREGRFRRYFDTAAGLGADVARVALLQTQPVPRIARAILAAPGRTQVELFESLVAELGISRQALSYHLRRLVAKDLIIEESAGRFKKYRPSERLERLANHANEMEPTVLASGATNGDTSLSAA